MIRIVRLGSERAPDDGPCRAGRLHPVRGVPKADYAKRNLYDVWLPTLAPSDALVKQALGTAAEDTRGWKQFVRKYQAEMKSPEARHLRTRSARYRIKRIFRSVAIVPTSRAAIARCCGNCSLIGARPSRTSESRAQ